MNKKLLVIGASCASVVALLAAPRASNSPPDNKIDFTKEASTISDPTNILLYSHEEIVNSFLSVKSQFGKGRVVEMHYENAQLATHRGTTRIPADWEDTNTRYQMVHWGLLGDVNDSAHKVYYLGSMARLSSKAARPNEILDSRPTNAFEDYATSQLMKGEKLVKWETPEFVHFVGGIYAAKSCLSCHSEAKEGDVLGAFTYEYKKGGAPSAWIRNAQVKAALAGQSYKQVQSLADTQEGHRRIALRGYALNYQLAREGVVLPEMVEEQKRVRDYVLSEATQLSRPKVIAPTSKSAPEEQAKSAR